MKDILILTKVISVSRIRYDEIKKIYIFYTFETTGVCSAVNLPDNAII